MQIKTNKIDKIIIYYLYYHNIKSTKHKAKSKKQKAHSMSKFDLNYCQNCGKKCFKYITKGRNGKEFVKYLLNDGIHIKLTDIIHSNIIPFYFESELNDFKLSAPNNYITYDMEKLLLRKISKCDTRILVKKHSKKYILSIFYSSGQEIEEYIDILILRRKIKRRINRHITPIEGIEQLILCYYGY